jgi:hypothetical protein
MQFDDGREKLSGIRERTVARRDKSGWVAIRMYDDQEICRGYDTIRSIAIKKMFANLIPKISSDAFESRAKGMDQGE